MGLLIAGSLGAAACLTVVAVIGLGDTSEGGLDPAAIGASDVVGIPPLDSGDLADSEAPATTVIANSISGVSTSTTISASITSSMPAAAAATEDWLATITAGSNPIASGVVLDGYIITSASAVGDHLSITVSGTSGASGLAYLVGVDPFSDLAVYRPSIGSRATTAWSAITFQVFDRGEQPPATPDDPTGDEAAILSPGDGVFLASATTDGQTIDAGMVIALDRDGETPSGQPLVGLIDTSIRRPADGAGSLLIADDGTPVGIVVDSASSLASAVPINDARLIAERLTEQGWANQSWLGFLGMDMGEGVEVIDVAEDGPAAAAGLQPGDLIAFLDGAPIDHMGGVAAALRQAEPGDAVVIVVERDGAFVSLRVIAQAYRTMETVTEPVGG